MRNPSLRLLPGLLAVLLLAVLVVGCGSNSGPSSSGDRSATPAPRVTSTPLPTGDGALVPEGLDISVTPTPTKPAAKSLPRTFGADVSWPQCPEGMGIPQKRSHGGPMPTAAARFLIVGLTNGPSFTPNPCLRDQVDWARQRDLPLSAYAVVSQPSGDTLRALGSKGPYDDSDRLGRLGNAGYQAALFTIDQLERVRLKTPIVWVDVEPVPDFDWSDDVTANAAVVAGTVRGYRDRGFRVGFYSTPHLWSRVVGDLRIGGYEWRAAGETSMREALSRCGDDWSFQGGRPVLGQWIEDGRDRNVTCPGVRLRMSDLFAR